MKLEQHELNSPIWAKLKTYYEDRLETFRSKNDGNLTPDETARLRGRIAEVKGLLALGEPSLTIDADAN